MSYSVDDLLYLMSRLRDPEHGCPWDLQQKPEDIINYSIEEVYELADAVEQGSSAAVKDELGDVLFQVVFFAQLAHESGDFEFDDIVNNIVSKLLRRHPHVFPDGELYGVQGSTEQGTITPNEVKTNWESIKRLERAQQDKPGVFDNVPNSLPALNRAAKLQKRAAALGLDWNDSSGPLKKVKEETKELESLLSEGSGKIDEDKSQLQMELGDMLFSVVNLCRKLNIKPEQALRAANRKFEARVNFVCAEAQETLLQGDTLSPDRLAALDTLWERAKRLE